VIQGASDATTRIVVGAGRTLYALDANGTQAWQTVLEGGDISTPAALVEAGRPPPRAIGAAGATPHAPAPSTGRELWSPTPSGRPLGAPSTGGLSVLVGAQAGHLFSLDAASGRLTASFAAAGAITASPAIGAPGSAPQVFAGDRRGDIYAFDQT